MTYEVLIGRLIARRKALKISQADLAGMIGTSNVNLHRWEAQRNRAKLEDLTCWAEALGLKLSVELHFASEPSLPADRADFVEQLSRFLMEADERHVRLLKAVLSHAINEEREA